jgi:hypothetical protein
VKVRDRVVLVNNVTALNKLASEIGRDAVKVINDINTNSSKEYGWNGFIHNARITTSEQFIADRTVYCVLIKYNQ